MLIVVEILIPLVSNEGEAFGSSSFTAFENVLTERFGGWTLRGNTDQGAWANDVGVVFLDRTRVYLIGVSGLIERSAELLDTVAFAKTHFSQEKICVRYLGIIEIL